MSADASVHETARKPRAALARRLLRGGAWVTLGRISGIALAFVLHMVLARQLEPAAFGAFALVISLITFCSIVARFGLDRVLLRFLSEGRSPQQALREARAIARSSVPAVAVLAGLLLTQYGSELGIGSSPALVLLIVAALALHAIVQIVAEALRGLHRLDWATLFDVQASGPLLNLILLGLVLVLSLSGHVTLLAVVGLYVAALLVLLTAALVQLRRAAAQRDLPQRNMSTAEGGERRAMRAMCGSITVATVLAFLAYQADLWIASVYCSGEDLARFAAARRLIQLLALPLGTINLAVISTIPELYAQGRRDELQRVLRTTATLATVPVVALAAAICIAPGPILELAFGSPYRAAAPLLVTLVLGQLVLCWSGTCGLSLTVTGHHRAVLWVHLSTVLMLLIAGLWAASNYGTLGIAVASTLAAAINNLLMWITARARMGIWTHAALVPQLRLFGKSLPGGERAIAVAADRR